MGVRIQRPSLLVHMLDGTTLVRSAIKQIFYSPMLAGILLCLSVYKRVCALWLNGDATFPPARLGVLFGRITVNLWAASVRWEPPGVSGLSSHSSNNLIGNGFLGFVGGLPVA